MYDENGIQIRTTEVLTGDEYPELNKENPETKPVADKEGSQTPREEIPVTASPVKPEYQSAETEEAGVSTASRQSAYDQNGGYRNDAYMNSSYLNSAYSSGYNGGSQNQAYQYQGTYRQMNPGYRENLYQTAGIKEESSVRKEKKKEKKQVGFFGRLWRVAVIGLVFGLFAGGGILAVRYGGSLLGIGDNGTKQPTLNYTESAQVVNDAGKKVTAPAEAPAVVIPASETVTTVVTDVSAVVDEVMPSIVSITNSTTESYYYYKYPAEYRGSGIIIGSNDEELLLVTNYHVVAENEKLTVSFCDGSEAEALVKGSDSAMDLAVIAVRLSDISDTTMNTIRIARMGDSDSLKVGEPAIAIGNALGIGQSVTTGVISALNRELDTENVKGTFIQTDAAINEGNSGGALLNINGEVIGINSSKIGGSMVEGMGYAIPISVARPIIDELMEKTTRTLVPEDERGYLGITGATITQQDIYLYGYPEGVYVVNVNDGSAADLAGMQRGDCITEFDGEKITSMEGLQRILMYYREGDTVEVTILRPDEDSGEYEELMLQLTLGDKSDLGRRN